MDYFLWFGSRERWVVVFVLCFVVFGLYALVRGLRTRSRLGCSGLVVPCRLVRVVPFDSIVVVFGLWFVS